MELNISFLLLIGALFSVISFFLAIFILKKVFEEKYRRPWLFVALGIICYAPAQVLRFIFSDNLTGETISYVIYGFEFIGHAFLMYGLLLELFIIKLVKGKFVQMRFIPIQEGNIEGTLSFDVTNSKSYLAYKKDKNFLLKAFKEAVSKGYQGFLLTTSYPSDIRGEYGLQQTPILMIFNPQNEIKPHLENDPHSESVDALHFNEMIQDIDNFYAQAQTPFVMIELDMILEYNPFEIVLGLLEYIKSKNETHKGVLILTIQQDSLSYVNLNRLNQEFFEFN
ncbi:MAG: DUF835 domain-containing protein [Candidatus Woesearchaeota archaeon]